MSNQRRIVAVVILALAAFGVMTMFRKVEPNDTAIDEHIFRLTLPGRWNRQPSSDATRWTYRSNTGRDQLTVSLLSSTNRWTVENQIAVIKRVTELRRRAETGATGGSAVTMTDATFGEAGGIQAARFGGVESARQRRFWCLLLCSSSAVTIFYYESIGPTEEEFDAKAKAIFNSVVVPQ